MSTPAEFILVCTSCDDRTVLADIAAAAVELHLAACAQISGPVVSTYVWEGAIETANEWLLSLKTAAAQWEALREFIAQRHSYQVPEIVAVPLVACSVPYAQWLRAHLAGA